MEFIRLHHALYSHSQTKECITKDSDHIPHSVCFKFKFGVSVRVLEYYSEQFKTLVEQTEQCISVLQLQLWDTIISLTELELMAKRATIASLYCKAVMALAIAFGFNASLDKMATKYQIYSTFKDPTVLKELTEHSGLMLDTTNPVTSFFIIFPNTMATLIILLLTNTLMMNTHHLNPLWVYSSMSSKVYLSTLGMCIFLPNYLNIKMLRFMNMQRVSTRNAPLLLLLWKSNQPPQSPKPSWIFLTKNLWKNKKLFKLNSIC